MKGTALIGLLAGLLLGVLLARSGPLSAQAAAEATCYEAITVFRDASRFSRRSGGAKNMTEVHDEFSADGWKLIDTEIYTENGDMEGFFLSYTREKACNEPVTGG